MLPGRLRNGKSMGTEYKKKEHVLTGKRYIMVMEERCTKWRVWKRRRGEETPQ